MKIRKGYEKRCGFEPISDEKFIQGCKKAIAAAFPLWWKRRTGGTWNNTGMGAGIQLDAAAAKHQP
jgi:hypothetical protein